MSDPWTTGYSPATIALQKNTAMDELSVVITCIQTMNANNSSLRSYCDQLGTAKDGKHLREQLSQKRDENRKLVIEGKKLLQKPSNGLSDQDKLKRDRLIKQFNDSLREFESIAQSSLLKEKEIVQILETSYEKRDSIHSNTDMQLKQIHVDNVDESLIEERNREILQIKQDLEQLATCFIDVATEVHAQQQDLDLVESNISQTLAHTENGTGELRKAQHYANSARIKYLVIVCIVILVLIAIIVAITCTTSSGCSS